MKFNYSCHSIDSFSLAIVHLVLRRCAKMLGGLSDSRFAAVRAGIRSRSGSTEYRPGQGCSCLFRIGSDMSDSTKEIVEPLMILRNPTSREITASLEASGTL
jgi:hypothetical protein